MNSELPNDPWNAPPTPPTPQPLPSEAIDELPSEVPYPGAYRTRLSLAWATIWFCVIAMGVLQYVAMQMLAETTAASAGEAQAFDPGALSSTALLVVSVAMLIIFAAVAVGFGLLITLVVLLANERLRPTLKASPPAHRTAYLEAFALFLVSFIVLQILSGIITEITGLQTLPLALLLVIAPIFWPMLLGVRYAKFKHDMGWTAPRGVFREIGAGVLGYVTGLPVVAGGIAVSATIAHFTGMTSDHPIRGEATDAGPGVLIMLVGMAVVWAPFVEEAIFRGSLYRHLRSRPGWVNWIVASLVSSFIFAAIHPQGLVGIPVLTAIAFVLASMREMRGSIIPCIVAHALNNAMAMALLIVVLYG